MKYVLVALVALTSDGNLLGNKESNEIESAILTVMHKDIYQRFGKTIALGSLFNNNNEKQHVYIISNSQ